MDMNQPIENKRLIVATVAAALGIFAVPTVAGGLELCVFGPTGCALKKMAAAIVQAVAANETQAAQNREDEIDKAVEEAGGIVLKNMSPEYWSGEGKRWSERYTLNSSQPPAGYKLLEDGRGVSFQLVGGRSCQRWAECREIQRTKTGVKWDFRMQGHEENTVLTIDSVTLHCCGTKSDRLEFKGRITGTAASSRAILRTRYIKE
jgi:hypothetical protein